MQKRHQSAPVPRKTSRKLEALIGAALAIPGIASTLPAEAQSISESSTIRFLYAYYKERQPGEDRMRIEAPMAHIRTPLSDTDEIEGSFVLDSLSGASPYYLNTLTGASGFGVEDVRRGGDLKYTHLFDGWSLGGGMVVSDEDDYNSWGGFAESKIWTPDKNTTFSVGIEGHTDDITSSIDQTFDDDRNTWGFLAGVTQVINPIWLVQSNLTFTTADGYTSDPYKPFDKRPESRDQFSWLTRSVVYIDAADASLHTDYRLYYDSFGIGSHTLELAWYQPLGSSWIIRPTLRYYTQGSADFFSSTVPPTDFEKFYSADQRMSGFGSYSTGLKVSYELPSGFSLDAGFTYIEQNPDFKMGGGASSVIEPLYIKLWTFGMQKRF